MSWRSMLMAMAVVEADPSLGDDGVATEITPEDAEAIRSVIRTQMAAFRAGNAERAWALSSAGIRQAFQSADRLLKVVREKYGPLASPKQVFFGEISITPDGLGQVMQVIGQDGRTHHALYMVEQDEDGVWKVNGCLLIAPREAALAA